MGLANEQLPVISLRNLLEERNTKGSEHEKLFRACHDYGFFYIAEHGITDETVTETIRSTKSFFSLPKELKEKYGQQNQVVMPKTSRGYVPLYGEVLGAKEGPDPKEIFDFGLEKPLTELPFTGPNIVPSDEEAPNFIKDQFNLQNEVMTKMVPQLLQAFAVSLDKKPEFFLRHFQEPILIHRTILYPAQGGFAGKHTDSGIFTILIQEYFEQPSLRVFTKNSWIDAVCLKNTFVVNLGDTLQKWTDGLLRSTPHEVTHSIQATRLSIPFFIYPQVGTIIEPITGSGEHIDSTQVMLDNYNSIWVAKTGAGRAKELEDVDEAVKPAIEV